MTSLEPWPGSTLERDKRGHVRTGGSGGDLTQGNVPFPVARLAGFGPVKQPTVPRASRGTLCRIVVPRVGLDHPTES